MSLWHCNLFLHPYLGHISRSKSHVLASAWASCTERAGRGGRQRRADRTSGISTLASQSYRKHDVTTSTKPAQKQTQRKHMSAHPWGVPPSPLRRRKPEKEGGTYGWLDARFFPANWTQLVECCVFDLAKSNHNLQNPGQKPLRCRHKRWLPRRLQCWFAHTKPPLYWVLGSSVAGVFVTQRGLALQWRRDVLSGYRKEWAHDWEKFI